MAQCSKCGSAMGDELERCAECGGDPEAVRCARCGEEFAGGDACPACGRAAADFRCEVHESVPAIGRCVLCGVAVCRECRRGDAHAFLCESHEGTTVIQGWAQVYSTTREFEASLLRDNLSAEGIDARIFSQKDMMFSVEFGELSIVRLLVPAWDFVEAERIIRAHMDAEGEVTFACPGCGEAYDPGTELCQACGGALAGGPAD
jgi:hypothetical protein